MTLKVAPSFAFAILLLASRAHAFCRETTVDPPNTFEPTPDHPCWTEGTPVAWTQMPVTFLVNQDASKQVTLAEIEDTMVLAFAQWQNAQCPGGFPSVDVKLAGTTTARESRFDGQNVIVFDDDEWPHDNAQSTIALTTVTFHPGSGEIIDADTEVNSANFKISASDTVPAADFDFRSVATHESGHFLGLAHSIDPQATMYPDYLPGTKSIRTLASDDVDGICAIYPPPTSGCSCSAADTPDFSWAWAVAAWCCRLARKRRGRRT